MHTIVARGVPTWFALALVLPTAGVQLPATSCQLSGFGDFRVCENTTSSVRTFARRGAESHPIAGRVTDANGHPIAEVVVRVVELKRSTSTNEDGQYSIAQLPSGRYTVSFAAIGYAPQVRTVTIDDADVTLDVSMKTSVIELPSIQVTGSAEATNPMASPQPMHVLGGEHLAASHEPSLGDALNTMPGMRNYSTGPAIGKPVIRGLTSTRVVVLDDGHRMESQQWGDEHGPSIEPSTASRIEVIRGPASVLYGSDALGGVVNVVAPHLPDGIGRAALFRGSLSGGYATASQQPDGILTLEGASGGTALRIEGTARHSENYRAADGLEVWNSAIENFGGTGTLGYHGAWGSMTGRYTYRKDLIHLTDEEPDATPFQRIRDQRASLDFAVPAGQSRLEIGFGYQNNRRAEYEEADAPVDEVGGGLRQNTYITNVHLHHPSVGNMSGEIGLSGEYTKFGKFGEETLIPNARTGDVGLFAFEQIELGQWGVSFGARYDYRRLNADADADLGTAAAKRTWNSVAGNVGFLYRVTEPVAVVLNVGRGFRAPAEFDLFSNGVHEGTLAFIRGNPNLKDETSLNTDLALRIQTSRAVAEFGGFANLIQNYIYTVPTTDVDPESGFNIFDVTQGDARLVGFEGSLEYHVTDFMHLEGTADYVNGQNTTTDQPLPLMPPFRATYALRLEGGDMSGAISNPYFSIGGESNARQSRLDPSEAEFYSAAFDGAGYQSTAYTLVNLATGFSVQTSPGRWFRVDLQLRNVLDQAWSDYLSRVKTNALDSGMGRNFIARFATQF
jgi:iron complex outermembrane recepter protein